MYNMKINRNLFEFGSQVIKICNNILKETEIKEFIFLAGKKLSLGLVLKF